MVNLPPPGAPPPQLPAPWQNDELSCDRLTHDIWLWQRRTGHRFSSDDTFTAWVAATSVAQPPTRICDLGCGIGTVLHHLLWTFPSADGVGIEAQEVSFALLQHNLAYNQLTARARVWHGDLRDAAIRAELGGPFPLVTGTPPYFPPGTAGAAMDEQRAYARLEYRGGVEAYLEAAAALVAPDGLVVLCGDSDAESRTVEGATANGLALQTRHVVYGRAGQRPLFTVWTFVPGSGGPITEYAHALRDAEGERTAMAQTLRSFSGL